MNKILTLWDIDGNLVNVYNYHTPAYQKAIEAVYGVKPTFEEIEHNYGLPAREVVSIPVRKFGIDEETIQKGIEEVFSIYSNQLEENVKTASLDVTLPGVLNFLKRIKSMNIPMGIVTGNIKKAGEAIIKGSNLYDFFNSKINSYGDKVNFRYEIVSAAINYAKEIGLADENTKIYVFGDTPADVEAAKKNNCISVAVIKNSNTEASSPGGLNYQRRRKALEESTPDFIFDDYTNLEEILVKIGIN